MICPINITLSKAELERARQVARARCMASAVLKLRDAHGLQGTEEEKAQLNLDGAAGELAFCNVMGWEWNEGVNTFKQADAGRDIQVRTAVTKFKTPPASFGSLVFHPETDNPNHRYVLIVAYPPTFSVRGWLYGNTIPLVGKWGKLVPTRTPVWSVHWTKLNPDLSWLYAEGKGKGETADRGEEENPAVSLST